MITVYDYEEEVMSGKIINIVYADTDGIKTTCDEKEIAAVIAALKEQEEK